jgi:hypothetical protein
VEAPGYLIGMKNEIKYGSAVLDHF